MYAGGLNKYNTSYYLNNGQNYWTMSPSNWESGALMLFVSNNGSIASGWVYFTNGLRPVINLLSNTEFKAGTNGTLNNPYEVI